MTTTEKAKHTPGAIRAGKNISDKFRSALPNLPESNAETLAAIIDAETHAPEMLEALEATIPYLGIEISGIGGWVSVSRQIRSAIQKAKGGQ